MQPPSIRFQRPDPRLQPYLTAYYTVEFFPGPPVEDLLMPEWANIRFALRGDWSVTQAGERTTRPVTLFGHTSQTGVLRCESPGLGLGVGILPLGWTHLLGLPAAPYVNRMVDPEPVLGPGVMTLYAQLLAAPDDDSRSALCDAYFLPILDRLPPPSPQTERAQAVLNDPAIGTVEAFAAALGVTPRHATRLSVQLFGFPPKLLLRRARFLRTLTALRDNLNTPWAEQLDDWYYDQSHFVRDFHEFMGLSPTAYFNSPLLLLRQAWQARAKTLGQSMQGLHPPRPDHTPHPVVSDSSNAARPFRP